MAKCNMLLRLAGAFATAILLSQLLGTAEAQNRKLSQAGPKTSYRLVSITAWNTTANVTYLHSKEVEVVTACKKWFTAGIVGVSAGLIPKPDWGSHVKVFDFATQQDYRNYSTCVSNQTARLLSQVWEIPNGKFRNLFAQDSATPLTGPKAGKYWHASLVNATNIALLRNARDELGKLISSFTVVKQFGQDTGIVAAPLDAASVVSFDSTNAALAYYYLKNGNGGTIPALNPQYTDVVKYQVGSTRVIEFYPQVIKAAA